MIAHWNIEQQSSKWFEMKWCKIGGTLSDGLLSDTSTLFIDIASQYNEEYEHIEAFSNYYTEHGNEYEPLAMEYLSKYTGLEFKTCGLWQSEENEMLVISPDGCTEDLTIACEIKCLGRKAHFEAILKNEIPSKYIKQCIHYFTVNPKLEKLYFIAYRERAPKHVVKELTLDSLVDIGLTYDVEIEQIGKKGTPIKPKIEKRKLLVTVNYARDMALKQANELLEKIQSLNLNEF